jgi:hypothetical protein
MNSSRVGGCPRRTARSWGGGNQVCALGWRQSPSCLASVLGKGSTDPGEEDNGVHIARHTDRQEADCYRSTTKVGVRPVADIVRIILEAQTSPLAELGLRQSLVVCFLGCPHFPRKSIVGCNTDGSLSFLSTVTRS